MSVVVRPAAQPKRREVVERLAAPDARNLTSGCVTAKHLSDFEIDEMRRVQRLARLEQPPLDTRRGRRAQQNFEEGRSVDDDHRASRSSRTASAGSGEGETGVRERGGRAAPRPSVVRPTWRSPRADSRTTTCLRTRRAPSSDGAALRGRCGSGSWSTCGNDGHTCFVCQCGERPSCRSRRPTETVIARRRGDPAVPLPPSPGTCSTVPGT